MDLRRSKKKGRSGKDRIDAILCGHYFDAFRFWKRGSFFLPRSHRCVVQDPKATFEPFARPSFERESGCGCFFFSGQKSHQPQRIRFLVVSRKGQEDNERSASHRSNRREGTYGRSTSGITPDEKEWHGSMDGNPCDASHHQRIAMGMQHATNFTKVERKAKHRHDTTTHLKAPAPASTHPSTFAIWKRWKPCGTVQSMNRIDGRDHPSHRIVDRTCVHTIHRCFSTATSPFPHTIHPTCACGFARKEGRITFLRHRSFAERRESFRLVEQVRRSTEPRATTRYDATVHPHGGNAGGRRCARQSSMGERILLLRTRVWIGDSFVVQGFASSLHSDRRRVVRGPFYVLVGRTCPSHGVRLHQTHAWTVPWTAPVRNSTVSRGDDDGCGLLSTAWMTSCFHSFRSLGVGTVCVGHESRDPIWMVGCGLGWVQRSLSSRGGISVLPRLLFCALAWVSWTGGG